MIRWKPAVLTAASLIAPCIVAIADEKPDGARWWSHVRYLADDRLEGRNTGSEGHRKAAEYVAAEFARAGLKPAGTDGFFQTVKLHTSQIDEAHSRLALVRERGTEVLALGEDANISVRVDPAPKLEAGLVFAGYGLSIPEAGHDDFRGLDVRGKVVVFLAGPPPGVPVPLAAHMQSSRERAAVLTRLGVVGMAAIADPKHTDVPWERSTLARLMPAMRLADPALDDNGGLKLAVAINPAHADKWLAGSGHTFGEILEAAEAGKPLPHFDIPARLEAAAAVTRSSAESQNVVAVLPGSDPKLSDEYVAFTAHLDHLGMGEPIKGDAIYNGAMDNASGIATMLDVAASLKAAATRPRRSLLFVAVTGEEKGLLGSRHFATYPTLGAGKIVADINVDMFLPLFPLKILTVYGSGESDLGGDVDAVARSLGIVSQGDPEPKRNLFIRSDQYSFIRRGIPALALKVGFDKGSPEEQTARRWLTERYHAPSDDLDQPVDKQAAGEFDVLVARLLERVANRDQAPRWNATSFFKRFAD